MSDTRISKPRLNKTKLEGAILYILNKCGPMSERKLQLLLYFIEFDYFEKYEEHLIGLTFIKTECNECKEGHTKRTPARPRA